MPPWLAYFSLFLKTQEQMSLAENAKSFLFKKK
jgi:hypothetical protein